MSDLLDGFRTGMQLGAPLVEAQLRKRAFQRQLQRDKEQREFEAEKLLARHAQERRLQESSQDAASALAKQREDGLSSRHSDTIKAQAKLASDSRDQRDQFHKDNMALAKRRLEEDSKSELEKRTDALGKLFKKRRDYEVQLNDPTVVTQMIADGSYNDVVSQYEATDAGLQVYGQALDMAVKEADFGSLRSLLGALSLHETPVPQRVFEDKPRPSRGNFRPVNDIMGNVTGAFDANTGNVVQAGQLNPATPVQTAPSGYFGSTAPNPAPIPQNPQQQAIESIWGAWTNSNGNLQQQ